MNEDLLNILANSNKDIDNQKLMDYLQDKLSEAEKHEVEKSMADNEFINDAVEGLKNMPDAKLQRYIELLNKGLKSYLEKNKIRRKQRKLKENPWIYIAIILILLLCTTAYLVVRKYLQ